jgi:SNF2 family DNA or RNA helicase
VKIFRLIAEDTMEERRLKRARQKLVLDALVIKKKGDTSALSTHGKIFILFLLCVCVCMCVVCVLSKVSA